jgi:two-component system, sensor histidine kinase LadS
MMLGAFVGLVTLLGIASLGLYGQRREPVFAAYAGSLFLLGMFNLTNLGLLPLFIDSASPVLSDRLNYVLASLTIALAPWLVRVIVQPAVHLRLINMLIIVQTAAMLCCATWELMKPTWLSYQFLNLGTLCSIALIYALVGVTWQRGESITRWVALSCTPIVLSIAPLILRNLGAIPNSWLTQYSVAFASMICLPALLYALLARSNSRREGRARAAGLPSRDALTGLPNMRSFLQHMHGSIIRANGFGHSYGLLLVELTNHAWFVKEHGKEIADRALILSSVRLQQNARDMDVICRLDGSHFVMLVEGACTQGQLIKLATQLSASSQVPAEALPVGSSLRLSISCALMPTKESLTQGDDAHAQLGWLVAAAEAAPKDQRKTVRSIGF